VNLPYILQLGLFGLGAIIGAVVVAAALSLIVSGLVWIGVRLFGSID
jgi:hypothetical protein